MIAAVWAAYAPRVLAKQPSSIAKLFNDGLPGHLALGRRYVMRLIFTCTIRC